MKTNNIEYLLGIDGGGTKTEFLLTDLQGNEIRRLVLGDSNPVNIGIENTLDVLMQGINKICENISYDRISVFAGCAGAKAGDNQSRISSFLSQFGFCRFSCGSDIDLALEISLNGKNGTAVIMGTGIVAFSRNGEKLYRTGGRGYLIDKGGSGFCIGSDALNAAFEFIDSRSSDGELLLKLIEKKLGSPLETAISEIYKYGVSYIASFAPLVFDAFRLGDKKSAEIIERNLSECAKIINSAQRSLDISDKKAVICGGLSKQKDIIYPILVKMIDSDTELTFIDEPMVKGAVLLAEKQRR